MKFNSDSALLLKAPRFSACLCAAAGLVSPCEKRDPLCARTQHKAAPQVQQTAQRCNDPAPSCRFNFESCSKLSSGEILSAFRQRFSHTHTTCRRRAVALQNFILQPCWNAQHMLPIQFTLCVMNSKHQNTKGLKNLVLDIVVEV